VEVDLFNGDLVNFGLGFGEAGEDFFGAIGGAGGEVGVFDSFEDDREAAVMVVFLRFDSYLGGGDCASLHFFGGDGPIFEGEFAEGGFDGGQGGTGVNQGAKDHIATDAGEAVEIGYPYAFHGLYAAMPPRRRESDTSLRAGACQMGGGGSNSGSGVVRGKDEERNEEKLAIASWHWRLF